MSAKRMRYVEATSYLTSAHDAWCNASALLKAARDEYFRLAADAKIRLCDSCCKPMPDYDNSQNCDECHLSWGSSTPEGRQALERARLDEQIERQRAERAKL